MNQIGLQLAKSTIRCAGMVDPHISLADFFRLDLPFIPHVGIANTPEPDDCKTIIDDLNAETFEIQDCAESLDVVEYDGETVPPLSGSLFRTIVLRRWDSHYNRQRASAAAGSGIANRKWSRMGGTDFNPRAFSYR